MTFNSWEDMIAYITSKNSLAMTEVGNKMKQIMKEEVNYQVYENYPNPKTYDRTGQMEDCIDIVEITSDSVTTEFQDNGDWTSYNGEEFFAMEGLESGKTYGVGGYRPQTYLMDISENRIESEIPREYKKIMNTLGVPIK